ncbi:MAG: hypothetical protein AAGA48_41200, partial [Myxococcota bacterium]
VKAMGGGVTLEMVEAHDVRVSSTQGDIRWMGALLPQSRLRLDSHEGDIEVRIPAESDVALSLSAPPGQITSAHPGVTIPTLEGAAMPVQKLRLKVGQGAGATVEVSTFRGRVTLGEP